MRAANRWTVFTDGGSQIRKIRDANDLRSYIYSLSVFSQDVQSLIPSKGLRKLNNLNLKTGRVLGDINLPQITLYLDLLVNTMLVLLEKGL